MLTRVYSKVVDAAVKGEKTLAESASCMTCMSIRLLLLTASGGMLRASSAAGGSSALPPAPQ